MIEHKMLHLFGGRMDAYGHDLPHGGGERAHGSLTAQLIRQHLYGHTGVGVYPMWFQNEKWWVKWGCCDIDTGDWSEAYRLAATLRAMGLVPHVERSRSKGWHVWVFSDGPVEAWMMRRALKVAYATIDLPAKEANPKAEHLRPEQVGNYVRLPFKGALNGLLERQVMMYDWGVDGDGRPVGVADWFNNFDDRSRVDPSTIQYWADKWVEPRRVQYTKPKISEEEIKQLAVDMPQPLYRWLVDGPKDGLHRSESLVALAYKLKDAGYHPDQIFGLITAADLRWGKYHERVNGEDYLLDIVERVMQ